MAIIKVSKIEEKIGGTGRMIGAELGEIVSPGDIVDFEDFISVSNSTIDEFVKVFIEKYGVESFRKIKFQKTSPLIDTLIKKAFKRRASKGVFKSETINVSGKEQFRFSPEFA